MEQRPKSNLRSLSMDEIDSMIEALILCGALEIVALDEKTGQPLYGFGPNIKEIMPELYKQHLQDVNKDIMVLWEKGFLDIDLLSDNPTVILTDKAFIDEEIEKISVELQISLLEVKRLLIK